MRKNALAEAVAENTIVTHFADGTPIPGIKVAEKNISFRLKSIHIHIFMGISNRPTNVL